MPLNYEVVSGYRVLTNVSGAPAFLLKVDLPRTIYQQGLVMLGYQMGSLLLFGLIIIVITFVIMERLVLARLAQLHADVAQIRSSGDLSLGVKSTGNDEISGLSQVLNDLFGEVESSRRQLKQFNEALEQRVADRTVALSASNEALRIEVSERQRAEIRLAAARDQAVEALRLKEQLLANVSHDVRTPLNVIILRCEMLLHQANGQGDARQQKLLETILFSAQELLTFFNSLLHQSQLQNRRVEMACEPLDPRDLAAEVSMLMQPLAEKKGLLWNASVDEALPDMLLGDHERLKQILGNLVDNAIKYTDSGTVALRMQRCSEDSWALSVSDTGSGIAQEYRERIFEPFWQVDGSPTRRVNRGVGLGLSIVSQLTSAMGGAVEVSGNHGGQGSVFTVTLPLKTAELTVMAG